MIKRYVFLSYMLLLCCYSVVGQITTTPATKKNTVVQTAKPVKPVGATLKKVTSIKPTVVKITKDSVHKTHSKVAHAVDSVKKKVIAIAPAITLHKDSIARSTNSKLAKTVVMPQPTHRIMVKTKPHSYRTDIRFRRLIEKTPFINLSRPAIYIIDDRHSVVSKDGIFYAMCGVFLLFGALRTGFSKYFERIFESLRNPSGRLGADRDYQRQNNLPSLLLNMLFCLSVGLAIALLLVRFEYVTSISLWYLWLLASAGLILVYLAKYLVITAFGWIFKYTQEAGIYTNTIFLVNKIIGMVVLPLLLVLAFTSNTTLVINVITIVGLVIAALLLYRYIVSFALVSKNMNGNVFHFFIYLCAVEFLPILILYKLFSSQVYHLLK